ncbi:MAG: hypothetical protein QNK37_31670 [Acidobacteriota bacterium]|nr:hypothetical protein [Acidobacteriota bacterium]
MLLLLMILACQPADKAGDLGIRIEKVSGDLHVIISPAALTATLNERLKLSTCQRRIISRIVLETSADAEGKGCSDKASDHRLEVRSLLRHMDRSIEKNLSPRQRARYQMLKKERGQSLIIERAKAE